jgi:hypothetical protein
VGAFLLFMANKKLTELTALTTPANNDLLPILDVSDSTHSADGTSKKITLSNLLTTFLADYLTTSSIGVTVQAYDADLAGLAGLASTGIVARTGSGTFSPRTITGTANEITATNGDGVSGAPTLSLPSALTFTGKTITGGTFSAPTFRGIDGWIDANETWTYASASTFTIAGVDRTSIYTKGTRLKFTQSASVKYAVVASSSFSTDTTVTIVVNTDYTIANAAISANYLSYDLSPQGYPFIFAFSTTYGGFSANPTPPNRFFVIGNACTTIFGASNEGTSNATSLTMTVPITSLNVSGLTYKVLGRAVDNGGENIGVASLAHNTTTLNCYKTTDGSTWTNSGTKAWQGSITYFF